MRNRLTSGYIYLAFVGICIFSIGMQTIFAQTAEKSRVRLNASYVKIIDGAHYLDIKASARIDKQNIAVSNIEVTVYNEHEDEEIMLGSTTTNMEGESRFVLENFDAIKPDSTNTYNLGISFDGNDSFKKGSKNISFRDAHITAKLSTKDSINYITATLKDSGMDSVIVGESLGIQIQRLFQPLKIGEEFNFTDENGTIFVPIEEGIPGLNGNLNIEVVLEDSDEYGTVKAIINAPIGKPIVEESTFDQRKMWSARNKTPIFLLIFPNLIIFGIWGLIIYLIINLFRISKF